MSKKHKKQKKLQMQEQSAYAAPSKTASSAAQLNTTPPDEYAKIAELLKAGNETEASTVFDVIMEKFKKYTDDLQQSITAKQKELEDVKQQISDVKNKLDPKELLSHLCQPTPEASAELKETIEECHNRLDEAINKETQLQEWRELKNDIGQKQIQLDNLNKDIADHRKECQRLENEAKEDIRDVRTKMLVECQEYCDQERKKLEEGKEAFSKEKDQFFKERGDYYRLKSEYEDLNEQHRQLQKTLPAVDWQHIEELQHENEGLKMMLAARNETIVRYQKELGNYENVKNQLAGQGREMSAQEISSALNELDAYRANKLTYDENARVAADYAGLEKKHEDLLNRYNTLNMAFAAKEKAEAENKGLQSQLEAQRIEIAAANSLNEQLINELKEHKMAFESYTNNPCKELCDIDEKEEKGDIKASYHYPELPNTLLTSLPDVVEHIGEYAAYKKFGYQISDLCAFLAGMAAGNHFLILQGMSGTGKSSLPRLVSEAICGHNDLISVESSWRDRNELLGYYNDFHKKFNAKDFTQALYRSSLESVKEYPSFIILDEMNLSRVEYYFSDFLSILEKDPQYWKIPLINHDIRVLPNKLSDELQAHLGEAKDSWDTYQKILKGQLGAGELEEKNKQTLYDKLREINALAGPRHLEQGHLLLVPQNVWFVGTVNRDESTFAITDKVYDRAQVIDFNKRAVRPQSVRKPADKYITATALQALFSEAQNQSDAVKIKNEVDQILKNLDDQLMTAFGDSFIGNRIEQQAEKFVQVYYASLSPDEKATLSYPIEQGLDYQISTKILRKLLNFDNQKAKETFEALKATLTKEKYPKSYEILEKHLEKIR